MAELNYTSGGKITMQKYTNGKLTVDMNTHNFTGTLVNWIKINGLNFARTTASDQEFTKKEIQANAERLASCWNACLNLENPESDLREIIEALRETASAGTYIGTDTYKKICEALALIKE
jgi:hypothetical protein